MKEGRQERIKKAIYIRGNKAKVNEEQKNEELPLSNEYSIEYLDKCMDNIYS